MPYYLYLILGKFFYLVIFLFGLAFGSFLNSWIWRHHENIRVSRGRSMCPVCRRRLAWYENIPVFSCLFLRGKCLTCKAKIPSHFIWVELSTALLFLFITWYDFEYITFDSCRYYRDIVFIGILLVIFIYDFLYGLIISEIVWMGVLYGLFFNYLCLQLPLSNMLYGALIAGGFFLAQYVVSQGRWIGGGDVRFGVLIGVWLGVPTVLVALFFAYITGAVFGLVLLLFGKKELKSDMAFGTFLAVGTAFALFYGHDLVNWYLNLLR